jgi:hypothetical protein
MNNAPTQEILNGLVTELRKLPAETGWVEFKERMPNMFSSGPERLIDPQK